jgi:hypothetical protein
MVDQRHDTETVTSFKGEALRSFPLSERWRTRPRRSGASVQNVRGGWRGSFTVCWPTRAIAWRFDLSILMVTATGIGPMDSMAFWTDVIRTGDRLRTQGDPWPAKCSSLATLALARWEVLNHQPGEASKGAGEALWILSDRAAASWPDAVYLTLAQWAYGTVLEAQGNTDEVRAQYRAAETAAPETFFGEDAARRLGRE